MWGLFGLDVESVAKNEVYDPSTGGYKEDVGDRLGNWIVGGLSGGSDRKAEIDKLTKAAHVKKLQDNYGSAIDKYGKVQGMETINKDSLARLDSAQLDRKLNNNKETKDALSYVSETYGIDPSSFAGVTDAATIKGKGAKQYQKAEEQKAETKRLKLLQEAEGRLAESRQYEAGLRADTRKHEAQLRSEDRRLQMERDSRQDLIRAEERKDNLELRRDNMNLEYARLAQADRQKAADRKDKAIMMLMQGLGNLGTAFTI